MNAKKKAWEFDYLYFSDLTFAFESKTNNKQSRKKF